MSNPSATRHLSLRGRRRWLTALALVLAAAGIAACGSSSDAGSTGKGPIVVAAIPDLTGPLAIYGKPKLAAIKLAIADINKSGGVLGRNVKLVVYDGESDPTHVAQEATQAVLSAHADLVTGIVSSAARDSARAVLDRNHVLLFHNIPTEGGICDRYVVSPGLDADQQFNQLIPYAIHKYGPKMYIVAADYNFGVDSAAMAKRILLADGGELVGAKTIPLTNSDFSSVISDIERTKPDFVELTLAGGPQLQFYPQFAASGLKGKVGLISNSFGAGGEQGLLGKAATGILSAFTYYDELKNPQNRAFLALWKHGSDSSAYAPEVAVDEWDALHLWANAVRKAGSTDAEKVIQAIQSGGVSYEGPNGEISIDPQTHHAITDVTVGQVNAHGGYTLIKTANRVPPSWTRSRCNLIKNPNTSALFTP
jgi:urea transport system substrate-binding protein